MKTVIREAINDTLNTLGLPDGKFVVEHPVDTNHGDYSCNVAMVIAKEVGKAPRVIAEQLLVALEGQIPLKNFMLGIYLPML